MGYSSILATNAVLPVSRLMWLHGDRPRMSRATWRSGPIVVV